MSERIRDFIDEEIICNVEEDIKENERTIRALYAAYFQGNFSEQDFTNEINILFDGLSEEKRNYFEEMIRRNGRTICRIALIREEEKQKAREIKKYKEHKRNPRQGIKTKNEFVIYKKRRESQVRRSTRSFHN